MNITKKLKKLPAPLEVLIGGVLVVLPTDPLTDVLALGLVAHGVSRLRKDDRTKVFDGRKYALVVTCKTMDKALEYKAKLEKYNYVRVTKATGKRKRYGKWSVWARKK